ncbi:MAG: FGGY family carbohydrate kinase [bacterium]
MGKKYVIGLDYGTDSVRAVLIEASTGKEITADIFEYPRWSQGKYCDPARNIFRQHPLDQLEGLESTIKNILNKIRGLEEEIAAISVTTTGSTPIAVDKTGCALALKEKFSENPNAMFVMWKDHASVKEADDINRLAKEWGGEDFSIYSGGIYSSEWFWSKLLHIVREDALVRNEIGSWVENCDWIPAVLTGNTSPEKMKRSRCAAGHKAMWHGSWGGLPSEAFLVKLDPLLTGFRSRLYQESLTADQLAGHLSPEWARKLGLPAGIPIGVGALDAHVGAVGAEIRP